MKQKQFSIQFIFILLLFLIIVILSCMIVISGRDIYNNINSDREKNYNIRVSLSYIGNKIRQADKEDAVILGKINHSTALVIRENYEDSNYDTWIYFYNGAIYENLVDEGAGFSAEDGLKVIDAEEFNISKEKKNLYKFTVKSKDKYMNLYLNLNSNEVSYHEQ